MIVIKVDRRGLRLGATAFALYQREGDGASTLVGFAELTVRDYDGADNALCSILDHERRPIVVVAITVSDGTPAALALAVRKVMSERHPEQAIIVE